MNISHAFRNLIEQWQRAVLSGVGVAVAAIAIVLLVSIGLGVQKDVTSQIDDLGAGILVVVPGKMDMNMGGFNPNFAGKSFLTDEAAANCEKVPGITRVTKFSFAGGFITYKEKEAFPLLLATTPEWFQMVKTKLNAGRTFTQTDTTPVCVIGSVAAKELFGSQNPLNQKVNINDVEYTIIGITQDKKSENSLFSTQSLSNVVYIPLDIVRQNESDIQIDRIFAQVDPNTKPDSVVKDLEAALAKTLKPQQFSVLTQEDLLNLIYQVMGILGTLVIGLTSIALFVGGIGIMTVMLLSVGERTKEIGIRKALGANQKSIFYQFLVESSVIGFLGVCAGLAVSSITCVIIANTTKIKPLLTPETILLTFAVGIGVGVTFGLIPAIKASRLDPVAALRKE